MKTKRKKYQTSYLITNLGDLAFLLDQGDWIYIRDRPKHPRVIENMSIVTLKMLISKKVLRKAILNKED